MPRSWLTCEICGTNGPAIQTRVVADGYGIRRRVCLCCAVDITELVAAGVDSGRAYWILADRRTENRADAGMRVPA